MNLMQLFKVLAEIRTFYFSYLFLTSFICDSVYGQESNSSCIDLCSSKARVIVGSLERSCFCTDCDVYDDCCSDELNASSQIQSNKNKNYKCNVKIDNIQFMHSIVKCDKDWQNEIIKSKCENETWHEEIYDLVPVYSNQTRLVYRNIYCAYCNMLKTVENLEFFKLRAVSYSTNQDHHDQNYLIESVFNDMMKNKHNNSKVSSLRFEFYFQKPSGARVLNRTCVPAVDSCPENSSKTDWELCQNYTAFRRTENQLIYKNEHCAICNGVKKEELRCGFPNSVPRYKPLKSLQLLFDFKYLAKNKMDLLIILNDGSKIDLSTQCQNETLQDYVCKNSLVDNLKQMEKRSCKYLRDETTHNDQIKVVITRVGQSISILSLLLLLSIYFSKKILQNLPGKILICLSLSLLFSQIFFLLSTYITEPIESIESFVYETECANRFNDLHRLFGFIQHALDCYVIGILIHYFYLSFFAWTLIMAYDLYKMFTMLLNKSSTSNDDDDTQTFIRYSIVAWTIPFLFVLLLFSSQFVPSFKTAYAYGTCFISNQMDILFYFIIPISLILILNAYFLAVSIRSIRSVDTLSNKYLRNDCSNESSTSQSRSSDNNKNNSKSFVARVKNLKLTNKNPNMKGSCEKKRTLLFLKLFILTGMSWMFGIINSFTQLSLIWYIYIVLNSFQGLFIFFAFAFNSQTKRELRSSLFYSQISKLFSISRNKSKPTSGLTHSTSTSSSFPRANSQLPSK